MKGLLIKDFKLMANLKSSFAIFLGLGIFFMVSNGVSFGLVYSVFFISTIASSTLNYDKHENGMSFILTLPVTRKQYVLEKYAFGIGLVFVADVVMVIPGLAINYIKEGSWAIEETLIVACVAMVISTCITAFSIPIDLKYEREKARVIGLIVAVVLCGSVLFGIKLISEQPELGRRFSSFIEGLGEISLTAFIIAGIIILAAMVAGAIAASIRMLNKKEF